MKKFNNMESHLIIDALTFYVAQVEKDILDLENKVKHLSLHQVFILKYQKS